jgi:hypothetical protein
MEFRFTFNHLNQFFVKILYSNLIDLIINYYYFSYFDLINLKHQLNINIILVYPNQQV